MRNARPVVEPRGVHRLLFTVPLSLAMLFLVAAVPLPQVRVVVFPLTATGSTINREASSQIATQIATQLSIGGGITPLPPTPGTERSDYLAEARKLGADYYITGFIAPLGDGVSIVEQVVSTQSGIVVFSNSAQIQTLADAAGQGDILRAAVLRHASRNLGAYDAPPPPPAAAPTAVASGNGSEANLGRLFGKKKKAAATTAAAPSTAATLTVPATEVKLAPTPRPAPVVAIAPTTPAPRRESAPAGAAVAILALSGPADNERKAVATQALVAWFERNGRRAVVVAATEPSAEVCRAADAGAIVGGSLDARADASAFGQTTSTAALRFVGFSCGGAITFNRTFERDAGGAQGANLVLERIASAAVGAYVHPPKR